jgi:UDP-glucuronate 4-epimerase
MKILVSGGAGFIGSHLVERLLELGHQVVCVDNFDEYYPSRLKRWNIASALASPRFRLVEGDISDERLITELFAESFAVVVHLAARAGVRPSIEHPGLYARVNVQGTISLLEGSRRSNVQHFIFGSSSSVYGVSEDIPFREENGALLPASPYGASKLAAEVYCATYHRLYGLPVTCLRFFTVYGPRQRPDMAIHRFAQLIEDGKPVPMYGDGTTSRDYTYVDDIIEGITRVIPRPDGYQIYNFGNSRTVGLRDLIATIEAALGKRAIISVQPDQPGDVPTTYASIERAVRRLGYEPRINVPEGVRRFVEWFRAYRLAAASP